MIFMAGCANILNASKEALMTENRRKNIFAGAIGNTMEFYDFAVFGYLAPVLGKLFFPSSDSIASIAQSYGVFAAGYLMRPLGGIIYGHFSDRVGRKQILQISIIMMAIPSILVGCLPTHDQIGVSASIMLLLLRLLQGLSVGGEAIGSYSFLGEMADQKHRGFFASFGSSSGALGYLLGSAVATLLYHFMAPAALTAWGWRAAFFLGAFLGGLGLWMRIGLTETPLFLRLQASGGIEKNPVLTVVGSMKRRVICLFGVIFIPCVQSIVFIWMPTYLTHMIKPAVPNANFINTISMCFHISFFLLGGWLSDLIGRKRVFIISGLGCIAVTYPLFVWMDQGTMVAALASQLIYAGLVGIAWGALPALMVEMFPTRVRTSGLGLAYNGAMAFVYGTAPLIATWLVEKTGHIIAPAFYIMVMALIGSIAVLGVQLRAGERLP